MLTNFQIEISKKRMDLQTCEQLCSMKSSYLCKMCVYFSELVFLNATNGYLHLSSMLIERNFFFFDGGGGAGGDKGKEGDTSLWESISLGLFQKSIGFTINTYPFPSYIGSSILTFKDM